MMKPIEDVMMLAMQNSRAWAAVFAAGAARTLATSCVEALDAEGYVIVPKSLWFKPDDGKPSDVQ